MIKRDEFYTLFGKLIYVTDIIPFGTEYQISYKTSSGTDVYISDLNDIREDFKTTTEQFDLQPKPKFLNKNNTQYFKLTYYNEKNIGEVVEKNITNLRVAHALKNTYKKHSRFKTGLLRVEPQ
jgi:hypothetical protein